MTKQEILDNKVWSYSSLSAYNQCHNLFKKAYVDQVPQADNAFAQWGRLCHGLFEQYYKGNADEFDLARLYENVYDKAVTIPFPSTYNLELDEKYYEQGIEYFGTFADKFADCKVLEVEKEISFYIGSYKFIGYIDLLLKDPDGNIIIADHKSKSSFKSKKERKQTFRQLYLYSVWVYAEYGRHPSKLVLNMFRANHEEEEIFLYESYSEALEWARKTIERICWDEEYIEKVVPYFCDNICGARYTCPHSGDFESEVNFTPPKGGDVDYDAD